MTTLSSQSRPGIKTGRYRQLVTNSTSRGRLPPIGGRNPACPECEKLLGLVEKVAQLESWRLSTANDLKAVLEVIRQAKVLMVLSISGGVLSLVSLALTIMSLIARTD